MGRGKRLILSLFGIQKHGEDQERRKIRPSYEFGQQDIDVKADEYIYKVHQKIEGKKDIEAKEYIDKVHKKFNLES
ncbi:hypothetical protein Cni_G25496 [Canna indica]|uniref:Uncharacterized protein n=1 Tax=Canna indica TaxID=4628 RepID=A0AAQ3QPC0_9LILI|nr:hypothetical protein Cni_G25496 [Canna indica]